MPVHFHITWKIHCDLKSTFFVILRSQEKQQLMTFAGHLLKAEIILLYIIVDLHCLQLNVPVAIACRNWFDLNPNIFTLQQNLGSYRLICKSDQKCHQLFIGSTLFQTYTVWYKSSNPTSTVFAHDTLSERGGPLSYEQNRLFIYIYDKCLYLTFRFYIQNLKLLDCITVSESVEKIWEKRVLHFLQLVAQ